MYACPWRTAITATGMRTCPCHPNSDRPGPKRANAMNVTLEYNARSAVRETESGRSLAFAPNLAREPVAFDAELRDPVRFREAISALHDVVISDLRFVKRDKSAYRAWQERREAVFHPPPTRP